MASTAGAEAGKLHPSIPWLPSGRGVWAWRVVRATCLCRHLLVYTGALRPGATPLLELSDGEGKLNLGLLHMQANIRNGWQVSNDSPSERYLFSRVRLESVPASTLGMSCEVCAALIIIHRASVCWLAETERFWQLVLSRINKSEIWPWLFCCFASCWGGVFCCSSGGIGPGVEATIRHERVVLFLSVCSRVARLVSSAHTC